MTRGNNDEAGTSAIQTAKARGVRSQMVATTEGELGAEAATPREEQGGATDNQYNSDDIVTGAT